MEEKQNEKNKDGGEEYRKERGIMNKIKRFLLHDLNLNRSFQRYKEDKEGEKKDVARIEHITSELLGYHSFYGRFSIFLFLSSILFFIALVGGEKQLLDLRQTLYYFVAGLSFIIIFNLIKVAYIRSKKRKDEGLIYLMDVIQTISISFLLFFFVNVAVGNNVSSLYRVLLFMFTLAVLYLSYLARRDILFRAIIREIYNSSVVVGRKYYQQGKGKIIIMNQEIIDKINYYSSYALFVWYLVSFAFTFLRSAFFSWRILFYGYALPLVLLVFIYSFIYSWFRKRAE